ncbi:hypothetical protein [Thalassotalea sp. Y01]|uniref:hypothetical protein n=1 Tax=Thalassotalea sp. Y01 TaxID=2729613 RepID=UPI00145E9054|nr:hypothetical protein [Thalassotalea sp. Y01]NMP16686.1 hypothetical protein [Thalassotalea sp. Y01]
MSWALFHFHCRYLHKQLEQGATKQQALDTLRQLDLSELFNNNAQLSGAPKQLLQRLLTLPDHNRLLTALSAYNQLDINSVTVNAVTESKYLRSINYMVILTVMYLLIATLFKWYVLPSFVDMYSMFGGQLSAKFLAFDSVYMLSLIAAPFMILFCYLLRRQIINIEQSFVQRQRRERWLFSENLNRQLDSFSTLLLSPVLTAENSTQATMKKLAKLRSAGIDVDTELPALLSEKGQSLTVQLEKYLGRCFRIIEISLYVLIGYLISVMYEPIFNMGALI